MKERGKKAVEDCKEDVFADFSISSSDMPCKKHPNSSSVGICPQCLKDRLVKLVCSECGEQRLSSCSCSHFSSSCMTADAGSVGRISFLIENGKNPRKNDKSNEVILLRRSASSCVEVKMYKGLWKIRRLFKKKKKEIKGYEKDGGFDDKNEVWVSDIMDVSVSRSRSLCSFRGGGFNDSDDCGDYRLSSAKISDFTGGVFSDCDRPYGLNEVEPRKSGVRGVFDESEPRRSGFRGVLNASEPRNSAFSSVSNDSETRKGGFRGVFDESEARKSGIRGVFDASEPRNSGFSGVSNESEPRKSEFRGFSEEGEPRKSGFREILDGENEKHFKNAKKGCPNELERTQSVKNMGVFSIKECGFNALDESAFIDLKLDSTLASITDILPPNMTINKDLQTIGHLNENGFSANGGPCRVTVNVKVVQSESGSSYNRVWKWLSRHYGVTRNARKKNEDSRMIE